MLFRTQNPKKHSRKRQRRFFPEKKSPCGNEQSLGELGIRRLGPYGAPRAHTPPISRLFGFRPVPLRPLWVPKGPEWGQMGPYGPIGPYRAQNEEFLTRSGFARSRRGFFFRQKVGSRFFGTICWAHGALRGLKGTTRVP